MARVLPPKLTDEEIIIEALGTYAARCDDAAPRHRHTAQGRELRRRSMRAHQLAHAYRESLTTADPDPLPDHD